jgi:hypothetical protein
VLENGNPEIGTEQHPGAGMAGGVWMETNGCGRAPILADQAIAMPGNAAKSETKY